MSTLIVINSHYKSHVILASTLFLMCC